MPGDDWRGLVSAAIRTALEAGVRTADDPLAYLGTAREEMRHLAERLVLHGDEDEEREIQIVVVQEISDAVAEMLNRLRH